MGLDLGKLGHDLLRAATNLIVVGGEPRRFELQGMAAALPVADRATQLRELGAPCLEPLLGRRRRRTQRLDLASRRLDRALQL
ncbi:MAG: hypothetical protein ACRET3_05785, partial [Burkholderiales bacterium]